MNGGGTIDEIVLHFPMYIKFVLKDYINFSEMGWRRHKLNPKQY